MPLEPYADFTTDIKKEDIQNLFVQEKEYNFMNHIASEFMQRIQGQYVHLIRIDRELTTVNSYGEAKEKIVQGDPIKLPAGVKETVIPINDEFTIRYKKQLRISFLQALNEKYGVNDIFVGDFLLWQDKNYEILKIDRNRKFFGQKEFVFEIICTAEARE